MRRAVAVCAAGLAVIASPACAQDEPIRPAIHAGLALCRAWVEGIKSKVVTQPTFAAEAFAQAAAGAVKVQRVEALPEGLLPAPALRFMSDYWHLDAGSRGGVFVASSRFLPRCEVAGGGSADFQPAAVAETAAPGFKADWSKLERKDEPAIDMTTAHYRLANKEREELIVSSAMTPGGRTDRVQFLATLMYRVRK